MRILALRTKLQIFIAKKKYLEWSYRISRGPMNLIEDFTRVSHLLGKAWNQPHSVSSTDKKNPAKSGYDYVAT